MRVRTCCSTGGTSSNTRRDRIETTSTHGTGCTFRIGHRRRAGPRPGRAGRGRRGEGLRYAGHSDCVSGGAGQGAAEPLPRGVGKRAKWVSNRYLTGYEMAVLSVAIRPAPNGRP